MSEHTPTTEEVRTAWYQLTINVDSFDRWLAEHDRQIAEAEREQIIHALYMVADAVLKPREYRDG